MSGHAKVLADALELSEAERLELASELIASVDGPPDADWDREWAQELRRRVTAANDRDESGSEWSAVRARVLDRLARK